MSYVEIIFMVFPKKISFGVNGPLSTQNGASSQLWICCKDCFTILHNERGQERQGNYIVFPKKSYSEQFGYFGSKMIWSHNFGSAVRFFLLILYNKKGQEVHENCISCFLRKNVILDHFLLFDWAWSKLSQASYYWMFKKSRHFFPDCYWILKQSRYN